MYSFIHTNDVQPVALPAQKNWGGQRAGAQAPRKYFLDHALQTLGATAYNTHSNIEFLFVDVFNWESD